MSALSGSFSLKSASLTVPHNGEIESGAYTIVRKGPIGGELGGLFHHHFGEDPTQPDTTFGGKKITFKGVTEMSSPAYNRTDFQISIDGVPYVTYGRIMLEKQMAAK